MVQLTGGAGYAARVAAIQIDFTTVVTLKPEQYFQFIFLNEPTDIVDRIKTQIGFQSQGKYEQIVGSPSEIEGVSTGGTYTVTYSFTDYDTSIASTHETDQKNYDCNDQARLYAPISPVGVRRKDKDGLSSQFYVQNGNVVLAGYNSIPLTSGTLYQSKLDELALRIRTKVTMKVGTMGGDNYQYLIDLPNIYTLIAS